MADKENKPVVDDSPDQPALVDPIAEENEIPENAWVTDEDLVSVRNIRWRKVIDNLMDGKTITDAYAKAYEIVTEAPGQVHVAAANGSRLLRNAEFKKLWRKVIEERGFNDETVDWALADLITNQGVEPTVRRAAIKDYNELRGRIIRKTDLTSGGKGFFEKSKLEIEVVEDPKTEDQSDAEDSTNAS